MKEFIEINYISPISKHKFNKNNKYYLVFINLSMVHTIIIRKIKIKNLDNINEHIRSFYIGKTIEINNQNLNFTIMLFEHNSNMISLFFIGKINTNTLELNNIHILNLQVPTDVIGNLRQVKYNQETDFLQEIFFNFETYKSNEKCTLFISKVEKSNKNIIYPYIFKFNITTEKYIYNRYYDNIIKEHEHIKLNKICLNNSINDYIKLVKLYGIDINKYLKCNEKTFKSMFMRKINPTYRKLVFHPYMNDIISCPNDGRLVGFDIKKSLKFNFSNDVSIELNKLVNKPYELINKNGFISRLIPSDYQIIHLPYSGYLTNIYSENNKLKFIVMRFENEYFIPNDVHEREYISVVYGHPIYESKFYPELLEVQPKTKLIYYLILIGNSSNDSIKIINNKLIDYDTIWLEKGEEIAKFNCCYGTTIFMTNRKIKFSFDIDQYSKINLESYIKACDVIGKLI